MRRVYGSASCMFVAEKQDDYLEALRQSCAPLHAYSDVAHAAAAGHVDLLVATPPCIDVSKAKRCRNSLEGEEIDVDEEASRSTTAQVKILLDVITSTSPYVVLIEQSDGLKTHHLDSYQEFNDALLKLPYWVHHDVIEAHRDCGSSHVRSRLGWVLIRSDVAR